MSQETSRLAYQKVLKVLGKRQRQVLMVFLDYPDFTWTNMELATELGWSINRVTPRVLELRDKEVLTLNCKRRCEVTGNLAMAWCLK